MDKNHFYFSGQDTVELAKLYQTPLYVLSEDIIRKNIDELQTAFNKTGIEYKIFYASKAFLTVGFAKLIEDTGIGIDVSSPGELYTCLRAGFDLSKIILHGSNKTEQELKEVLDWGIKTIVVDSLTEVKRLQKLCEQQQRTVDIYIRINPGVDAHTNKLINTGLTDTKFGIPIEEAESFIAYLKNCPNLYLTGLHSHIGSQITIEEPFIEASKKMLALYKQVKADFPTLNTLDLGGGFGIAYTDEEARFSPEKTIPKLVDGLKKLAKSLEIELPIIAIEPGRFIVGDAGITLYTVGTIKDIPGIRTYVSVDGGMGDNPRPALYGAEYTATICNRPLTRENARSVRVAGRACETDTLIEEIKLAAPREGDILAVFNTGAYNYTMASHYNRFPKPAVVLLTGDDHRLLVKRESYADLIQQDCI